MANKFKGEVEFEAGDEKYKLSFSANALVEMEEVLGVDFNQVIERLQGGKMSLAETRKIFWAGLLDHQPETTMVDAKRILSKLAPTQMAQLVGEAFTRSMGDSTDETATASPRPLEPAPEAPAPALNGAGLTS